jgi:hypothetical protein
LRQAGYVAFDEDQKAHGKGGPVHNRGIVGPLSGPTEPPPMKRTDLEKNKGLKIASQMRQAPQPGRFGAAAASLPDRREQRKIDQANGLVSFAVKLNGDLVKQLQTQAEQEGVSLPELVDRVIRAGLAAAR